MNSDAKTTPPDDGTRAFGEGELQRIRLEFEARLAQDLQRSLDRELVLAREKTADKLVGAMRNTFERQIKEFMQIEWQLVLNISQRLTLKYQDILNTFHERSLNLYNSLEVISEHVVSRAERLATIESRQQQVDLFLYVLSVLIALVLAYWPQIPQVQSLRLTIPIAFCIAIYCDYSGWSL